MSDVVTTEHGTYGDIVDAFGLDHETEGLFYRIMEKAEQERKVVCFQKLVPGEVVFTLTEDVPTEDECAAHGVIAVVAPENVIAGSDA